MAGSREIARRSRKTSRSDEHVQLALADAEGRDCHLAVSTSPIEFGNQ